VLGETVATQLFGVGDPLGRVVRVKAMPCEVVGVLEGKGQSSQGQDQDDLVVMPWVTFKSRMMSQDRIHVGSILVSAVSPDEVSHAQTQVRGILRQQHRQPDGELDDFTVRNLADLAATQEKAADAQTGMLRNVAAVSLLVGGIGIMNIMLVSVTERTREIGIRLAIGASENKVLLQFLVEAGGAVGSRRADRYRARDGRRLRARFEHGMAPRADAILDPHRVRHLDGDRRHLRLLPCSEGRANEPHRCPSLRVSPNGISTKHAWRESSDNTSYSQALALEMRVLRLGTRTIEPQ